MIYLNIADILVKCCGDELPFLDTNLSKYLVEEVECDYDLMVKIVDDIPVRIGRKSNEPRVDLDDECYLRTEYYDERDALCAFNQIDKKRKVVELEVLSSKYISNIDCLLPFSAFEKFLWVNQRYMLHSSVVEVDGKSVAFVGPSGIGKSTQAGLWEKYCDARIVCGDRSALHIEDGMVHAYGIPFDGTAMVFSNIKSQLIGIVCLRQGSYEKLERLSVREAFREIYPQLTVNPWNKEFQKDAIDFAFELLSLIPVYQLTCRISKEAVDLVRGELYGD